MLVLLVKGQRAVFKPTVNVTGETMVLNKNFPSIKQGFTQLLAENVVKIGFVPA